MRFTTSLRFMKSTRKMTNNLSVINVPFIDTLGKKYTCACLAVDGKTVGKYLDEQAAGKQMEIFEHYTAEKLACAWSPGLDFEYCDRFMSELLNSHKNMVIPYLLCDDDMDFSCLVITADIRYDGDYVYLDKLSSVNHSKSDDEREYGIAYSDAYTDEDWKMWKEMDCPAELWEVGSKVWKKWIKENWQDEQLRRLRNYFFPYIQNPEHLNLIAEPKWKFERSRFEEIIAFYQSVKTNELNCAIPDKLKG